MSKIIRYEDIESKIHKIRGQQVILDRDVAELYGVETKVINQAVNRNTDKFPEEYILTLCIDELTSSRSQIVTLNEKGRGHNIKYPPKAFTERGLYMLATILKSPVATQTTIAIIDAFAKLRELSQMLNMLPDVDNEKKQKSLMQRAGNTLMDLFDSDLLETTEDETALELNLAFMKFKRSVKREKRKE